MKAVPPRATTLVSPARWAAMASVYPSTIPAVDVLGLFGVGSWEYPPGESDHVSGRVPDGEDHPASEDVVGAAPAGVGYSGLDRCFVVSDPVAQSGAIGRGPSRASIWPNRRVRFPAR